MTSSKIRVTLELDTSAQGWRRRELTEAIRELFAGRPEELESIGQQPANQPSAHAAALELELAIRTTAAELLARQLQAATRIPHESILADAYEDAENTPPHRRAAERPAKPAATQAADRLRQFAELVDKTLAAQREYFAARKAGRTDASNKLETAKTYERQLRAAAGKILDPQGALF